MTAQVADYTYKVELSDVFFPPANLGQLVSTLAISKPQGVLLHKSVRKL